MSIVHLCSTPLGLGRALVAMLSLLCALLLPAPSIALPVTYKIEAVASGSLGTKSFANAAMTLTFKGDTVDIKPYSILSSDGKMTTGYEILTSNSTEATFSISIFVSGGAPNILSGTFLSSAGIFVSVDNTNGGIGFGSMGVQPGQPGSPNPPNFPGLPVYPEAEINPDGHPARGPASTITI